MKTVSVLMPCYNDGAYIEEAVASVWAQTWPSMELIIVDDGSTDEQTREVLDRLAEDSRCTLLKQENSGPAVARNLAFQHAHGEYLMPVDADDKIAPDYVEKAVACLEADDRAAVCYCKADLFGELEGPWNLPDYSLGEMLTDNVVFVTSLIRRKAFEEVGGFNEDMREGMEDYDFFLSLLERGWTIHQLPETLFHYRIKGDSRSRRLSENNENMSIAYGKIWKRHAALFSDNLELLLGAARSRRATCEMAQHEARGLREIERILRDDIRVLQEEIQERIATEQRLRDDLHEKKMGYEAAMDEVRYLSSSIRDKSPKGMARLFMMRYGKLHDLEQKTQEQVKSE